MFTLKKAYADRDRYTDYLWSYFWSDNTMKMFGTRNTYEELIDKETGRVLWIRVYNSKAPKDVRQPYYIFIDWEDGEKTTKVFYTREEVKEFLE